jgi:trehalose-phosphatase
MTHGSILLAFDFDGTIAPICYDPDTVQMYPAAAVLLAETSQMRGVAVAISSGRDADDLASRIKLECAYLIASHGLEIRAPGGVRVRDARPLAIDLDPDLRAEIADRGLRLEQKKHAVALHWRGLGLDGLGPTLERFRTWATAADLEVIDGRCVVEARCPGAGKEEALRWLASAIGASRVIYAGDDTTDFGALRFASQRGRGVFIASSERIPPAGVTVVESFRELFYLIREEVML